MIEEWLTPGVIAGVGFPMALCIYLIVKVEKAMNNLTDAVKILTISLAGKKLK